MKPVAKPVVIAPKAFSKDPLLCSKCGKKRTSQSSWFWSRWHQCQRVYCDTCGDGLVIDELIHSYRERTCESCYGGTSLIY